MEYNFLNLVGKVKNASNTTLASYRWLPDGTKLGVSTPANTGFEYLGSLIYTRTGANAYTLESAPFDGGRIIAGSSYVTQYFVTDHLGSTRVAFNQNGTDLDRSDYYPTGERWADPALPATTNRWQYNGKERQTTGMPTTYSTYLDYGARMYDSKIGRWHTIDPLSEKYYGVSPYVYCNNNPVSLIDRDGKAWFHNKNGQRIGHDGNYNDQSRYVIQSRREVSAIRKADGRGLVTSVSSVSSGFRLPSDAALRESLHVLNRTIEGGGRREHSSLVMKDGTVTRGEPGAEATKAGIVSTTLPDTPSGYTNNDVEASVHSHITDVFDGNDGKLVASSASELGPGDPAAFSNYGTNIIAGPLGEAKAVTFEGKTTPNTRSNGIAIFGSENSGDGKAALELTSKALEKILNVKKNK